MPLFSYHCSQCNSEFETLVLGSEQPTCPDCGTTELEKRLSRIAPEPRVAEPVGACAACPSYGGGCMGG